MKYTKVTGTKKNHMVKLFALSTCGWCKKTKTLFESLNIEYEYVDVDQLSGDDLQEAREELRKYNPRLSHPTTIIDEGKTVIIGFKEDELREVLNI